MTTHPWSNVDGRLTKIMPETKNLYFLVLFDFVLIHCVPTEGLKHNSFRLLCSKDKKLLATIYLGEYAHLLTDV